ncbi:MAG: double-strand break repair helicase AddA [Pseudomonadota bacterium]
MTIVQVPDDATQRQITAADPGRSTWLAANAGSGKTRVLTDRVARLLLAGVLPQRILCLTYTKAAASEMQNRLFKRLGAWSMLDNDALKADLRKLGDTGPLDDDMLANARTLFARAIETPGGLKIQTIHSFCASVLRKFPLEAGVSPQFREMDERLQTLLVREVLEAMADGPDQGAFDILADAFTGAELEGWVSSLVGRRQSLLPPKSRAEIWAAFGLPEAYSAQMHVDALVSPGDVPMLRRVASALAASGSTDQKLSAALNALALDRIDLGICAALESLFVYGDSTKQPGAPKVDRVPTKAGRALVDADLPQLQAIMTRCADLQPKRQALETALRTAALHQFAQAFFPAYDARKQAGSWLDFDDLIDRTRVLLAESKVAAWVLFRLDGGIDHILVDEAQDTSPAQWDVIRQLAQEFTAGEGARTDTPRTIFVVGDKKQSIYSFQGADPQAFDDMRDLFQAGLEPSERPLQELSLQHSFRSSPAILDVVDATFAASEHRGLGQDSDHIAFKSALPGRVDLWDPVQVEKSEDETPWYDPIDRISDDDPKRVLAEKVAEQIQHLLQNEALPTVDENDQLTGRRIEPRDILILVQGRRSGLFQEIIRACKSAGLPMAGADRLNVAQELAVKDIAALLSFLATPEDDLSLASVLRSPLFGWSEQALFDLAHRRVQRYLWPALRDRAPEFETTVGVLQDLLAMADFLRPFDLIDRILTRYDGRAKLIARLGAEAEDAIDALLAQALSYEQTEVPNLTGFLTWLAADDLEIKRKSDTGANQIRVMTVHGAKGLESPIVILPDCGPKRSKPVPDLITMDDMLVWTPAKGHVHPPARDIQQRHVTRQAEENQRLLYVAMTRAESWLIVGAAGDVEKSGTVWYKQIEAGLTRSGANSVDDLGLRYEPLGWVEAPTIREADTPTAPVRYLPSAPRIPEPAPHPRSPSDLGGAKTLPGTEAEEDAMPRGSTIHALLQYLPDCDPSAWPAITRAICDDHGVAVETVLPSVRSVLKNNDLAHVFGAQSLAEVDLFAHLPQLGGTPIRGSVDRLIVGDGVVTAIDHKTNRIWANTTDDVPEGLLRQMGAYAAALEKLYPHHRIDTAILWTEPGLLMPLPHQAVNAALQRAAVS